MGGDGRGQPADWTAPGTLLWAGAFAGIVAVGALMLRAEGAPVAYRAAPAPPS